MEVENKSAIIFKEKDDNKLTMKQVKNYIAYLHMSSLVMATAISYTGNLLSRNRYLPMSVSADAASIASLPTRLRSKYGVASLPYK